MVEIAYKYVCDNALSHTYLYAISTIILYVTMHCHICDNAYVCDNALHCHIHIYMLFRPLFSIKFTGISFYMAKHIYMTMILGLTNIG